MSAASKGGIATYTDRACAAFWDSRYLLMLAVYDPKEFCKLKTESIVVSDLVKNTEVTVPSHVVKLQKTWLCFRQDDSCLVRVGLVDERSGSVHTYIDLLDIKGFHSVKVPMSVQVKRMDRTRYGIDAVRVPDV